MKKRMLEQMKTTSSPSRKEGVRQRFLPWAMLILLVFPLCMGQPARAAAPGMHADQLNESQVKAAVETWVRLVTADARPEASVELMEPYYYNDEAEGAILAGYIGHLSGGGFCLAGASRLLLPVYLYVPSGRYDPADTGLQNVLWEMGTRLQYMRLNLEQPASLMSEEMRSFLPELQEREQQWESLMAGNAYPLAAVDSLSAAPTQMELPLTSQWNQNSPYNDQCPNLTPGVDERTLTGCVATSISQAMYYWRWPNTGVGTDSVNFITHFRTNWDSEPLATNPNIPGGWNNRLEWVATAGGQLRMNGYWEDPLYFEAQRINAATAFQNALAALWSRMSTNTQTFSANFGATTYNWNAMQNIHSDPVDNGDADVAQLMLHTGIAFDTSYGVHWSGSDMWRTVTPLINNFRYDSDLIYGHPDTNLNQTLYVEEIQWQRPVPYCGTSPTFGGHAWVLFGYNQNTSPWQYKMNMGWGGGSDGWYSLDQAPMGLVNFRCHLVQLAPNSLVSFVGATSAGDGTPANPYQNIEAALASVPNGSTLIFKAGSVNTFSAATLTINRPLTLKGKNATIQK